MTALPGPEPPIALLTVDAYAALGEDDRYRSEIEFNTTEPFSLNVKLDELFPA